MDFPRYLQEIEARRAAAGPADAENLVIVRSVDSTNRLARSIVSEYEKEDLRSRPFLVLALEQTEGRGRSGRSWKSPLGKGVYATRMLAVDAPGALQTLPLLIGTGICRALSPHLSVPCRLKWPNDVMVEGPSPLEGEAQERRKIGGILIEAMMRPGEGGVALVGFGVNLFQEAVDLPPGATSLRLEGRTEATLASLTWDLVTGIERELAHLGDDGYAIAQYRERSVHRPGDPLRCRIGDRVVEGTFLGFDEIGRLRLESGGEEAKISAGEVFEE